MSLETDHIERIAQLFCQSNFSNVYGACSPHLTDSQRESFPPPHFFTTNLAIARRLIETLNEPPLDGLNHPLNAILGDLRDDGSLSETEFSELTNILAVLPIAVQDDIFDALLMDRFAFVNHSSLKSMLKTMIEAAAADSILTISGAPKSGKTYCGLLLKHYCKPRNEVLLCEIKMTEDNFRDLTVESMCRDLLLKLSYAEPIDFRGTANLSAWCEDMACLIVVQINHLLNNSPYEQIWFVFDGFGKQLMEHEDYRGEFEKTSKFLQCFYRKFTDGVLAKKCRLVISGYEFPLQDDVVFSSRAYSTTDVTELDVKQTVKSILARSSTIDQVQLDDMVDEVFQISFGHITFPIKSLDVLKAPFEELAQMR